MSAESEKKIDRIEEMLHFMNEHLITISSDIITLKTKVSGLETQVSGLEISHKALRFEVSDLRMDLHNFRKYTEDRFDDVDGKLAEMNENIGGIVSDYHPRIIALEKATFDDTSLEE